MIEPYASQSIILERRTGFNVYSEPVTAAPVTLSARVQLTTRQIRTSVGDEVMSDADIYLAPGTHIDNGDAVTYRGETYQVLAVRRLQGLDEEAFVLAFLGRVRGS